MDAGPALAHMVELKGGEIVTLGVNIKWFDMPVLLTLAACCKILKHCKM